MECKNALTLLEPYLDKELDRADARELETHVDGCIDCRAALTRLDELRLALRDTALRHVAPRQLRDRIAAASAAETSSSAPARSHHAAWRAARAWRIAAACILAFGAGGISVHWWNSAQVAPGERAQINRDLFASHWRALAAASPVDVVSSDRHTVKPWFAGKIAGSTLVQDFVEQGFPLVGGRIDYVGTQRVAVLVYRHGQHLIDVFVLPDAAVAVGGTSIQMQGYALEAIELGNQPAAIVSDMDQQERVRFAQLLGSTR
jgi:anti-sigma factor RsiW